jgi:hypothetical protein
MLHLPVFSPAQTIGGNSVFSFINLAHGPQLSALGNYNITQLSTDASLGLANPALLKDSMHSQLHMAFNAFFDGTAIAHTMGVLHSDRLRTTFAGGLYYFNYGATPLTDPGGAVLGTFRPREYALHLSAAQRFGDTWDYGVTLKFVQSNYGNFSSNGILADFGVTYTHEPGDWRLGFVAKNMGTQLRTFNGVPEDIPFDVQLGFSKKLKRLPLQISLTAHHVHQFDIRYNDTSFDANPFTAQTSKPDSWADQLFRHFVLALQYQAGKYAEFTLGYNYLKRAELRLDNTTNGLNGLSAGVGIRAGKLFIRYAKSYYQNNRAYNHLGIQLRLKDYFNLLE